MTSEPQRDRRRRQGSAWQGLSLERPAIWCEFQSGRLVLQGQVPSFYHKQLAQEAVAGLEGVAQVVNDIEVIW